MSGLHGGVEEGRSDFELSDEMLSIIPTDPFEQLDTARKITSMAISSRVLNLEAEVFGLRQKLHERDTTMHELEEKTSRMKTYFEESDSRFKIVLHENTNLKKESDSLTVTIKNLTYDMAKLETFKRQLVQSLSNENDPHTEPVDTRKCDMTHPVDKATKYRSLRISVPPYKSPWITPNVISPSNSTTGSPKKTLWYPSSQQSSASNSPPRGIPFPSRSPRIDGKEFFRQARSRLSYEQFRSFLANIKELNAQKQTREETMRRANEILGTENKDLYLSFQGLVTNNKR